MTRPPTIPAPFRAKRPDGSASVRLADQVRSYWGSQAYVCQLCGGPIPETARLGDPLRWTMDHVLPLALAGGNDLANLQPAHNLCNLRKNASPTPATRGPAGMPTSRAW